MTINSDNVFIIARALHLLNIEFIADIAAHYRHRRFIADIAAQRRYDSAIVGIVPSMQTPPSQ